MTKIVIVGAGFGGLSAALGLEKTFRGNKNISITLVDRHDYHLFTPNLYEVAAADEEVAGMAQLTKSICLSIAEIIRGKHISFIKGEMSFVDQRSKRIKVGVRELDYDYLILSPGSQNEYFGIEGAKQYSLSLKNLKDALRIRNAVEFAVQAHKNDSIKQYVRLVVAGGGYSGVELAGEICNLSDFVAWKNGYPREKIEITVIEAANQLIAGFDKRASNDIFRRLENLGVRVKLLSPIFKVDQHFIELASKERLAYDVLIWTTGVSGVKIPAEIPFLVDRRGHVETNEFLEAKGNDNVFVIGDCGQGKDPGGVVAPDTAQAAIAKGRYMAYALPVLMKNKKPRPFTTGENAFIVAVGGKWGIFKGWNIYITGFIPFVLRVAANLRYFAGLIGWYKSVKYVLFQVKLYDRND